MNKRPARMVLPVSISLRDDAMATIYQSYLNVY
jgi:hypothetical protein